MDRGTESSGGGILHELPTGEGAIVISPGDLDALDPVGPAILVVASGDGITESQAVRIAALTNSGRRIHVLLERELPADVGRWLTKDRLHVVEARQPVVHVGGTATSLETFESLGSRERPAPDEGGRRYFLLFMRPLSRDPLWWVFLVCLAFAGLAALVSLRNLRSDNLSSGIIDFGLSVVTLPVIPYFLLLLLLIPRYLWLSRPAWSGVALSRRLTTLALATAWVAIWALPMAVVLLNRTPSPQDLKQVELEQRLPGATQTCYRKSNMGTIPCDVSTPKWRVTGVALQFESCPEGSLAFHRLWADGGACIRDG